MGAIDDVAEPNLACAIELFRIANVRRHARATTVTVSLRTESELLVLEGMDDGVGLGERLEGSAAVGLPSIRHRGARLGAEVALGARAFGGTIVRIAVHTSVGRREGADSE